MNEPRAGAPAFLLIGSGVLTVLYSIFYFLWTSISPVTYLIAVISNMLDGTSGVGEALIGWLLLSGVPLVQLVGFTVTGIMGLLTMFGGLRLNSYRSRGVAWLAVLCSTAAPLLALLVNAGSALNLGAMGLGCITGCLFGNIPTLVVLLLGVIASIVGGMHISSYGNRFGR